VETQEPVEREKGEKGKREKGEKGKRENGKKAKRRKGKDRRIKMAFLPFSPLPLFPLK
jgi:hypothetical protein